MDSSWGYNLVFRHNVRACSLNRSTGIELLAAFYCAEEVEELFGGIGGGKSICSEKMFYERGFYS